MILLMRDKENIEKGTFSDLELASMIGISLEELLEIKDR